MEDDEDGVDEDDDGGDFHDAPLPRVPWGVRKDWTEGEGGQTTGWAQVPVYNQSNRSVDQNGGSLELKQSLIVCFYEVFFMSV